MTTIFHWLGQLLSALFYAALVQLAARLTHQALPQLSRGLYRAIGLREVPADWLASFLRFAGLFLLADLVGGWLGIGWLATGLVLAWLGWNSYQAEKSPQEAAPGASGGQGLSFTLRTVSGPVVRLNDPFRGTFIAGGAGSGKSKSVIEPIIQQAGAQGLTGVVYDFKFPTLAEEVAGSYAGSPVTPYFVNFTDLSRSHRVNPLAPQLLATASFAREAATTIGLG